VTNDREQYKQWIAELAHMYGVPERIALAQAQQESGTRQYDAAGHVLRGKAGEVGIFQVKPSTAPGQNLEDPHANITAGIAELARLYERFGHWELALAAYNWGEQYVKDWLNGVRRMPAVVGNYVVHIIGRGPLVAPESAYAASASGSSGIANRPPAPAKASHTPGLVLIASGVLLLWLLD
jgi:hypothetical protein